MPYIPQDKRKLLDPAIAQIVDGLRQLEADDYDNKNCTEGNLNYVISSLLGRVYMGRRYAEINTAIGVMGSALLEYYIRVALPYEKQKAFENGDVYSSPQS